MIGVFNRSHYEDVLVVRVKGLVPEPVWRARYGQINDFERMLTASGTTILKFFLHISKDEQKQRLEARIATPEKHWKFDPADLDAMLKVKRAFDPAGICNPDKILPQRRGCGERVGASGPTGLPEGVWV